MFNTNSIVHDHSGSSSKSLMQLSTETLSKDPGQTAPGTGFYCSGVSTVC